MSPRPVAFVTGNPGKLSEARRLAGPESGLALEAVDLDLPEIQSLDLAEVLRAKGEEAYGRLRRPLVVEETGFEIDAFGGFPGPLVKWMLQAMGAEGMARAALATAEREGAGAGATARCLLLFVGGSGGPPEGVTAEGVARGRLVHPPRGGEGFGWDPVFQPDGETRTFGELPAEEKDRVGHRGRAWRALARKLRAGP